MRAVRFFLCLWIMFSAFFYYLFLKYDVIFKEPQFLKWLFVEWENVVSIKVESLIANKRGPVVEMKLNEEEKDRYFKDVVLTQEFFDKLRGDNSRSPGTFKVGYTTIFHKHDKVVKKLNRLKLKGQ